MIFITTYLFHTLILCLFVWLPADDFSFGIYSKITKLLTVFFDNNLCFVQIFDSMTEIERENQEKKMKHLRLALTNNLAKAIVS